MTGQSTKVVTVFGGTGFVGRYVVKELAERGWRIRVANRHPERAGFLQPLGTVGQIHAVYADLRKEVSVHRAVEGAEAVVNLVGILAQGGAQSFKEVHTEGARRIAQAAWEKDIHHFVQMSAIGAAPESTAKYGRSKAQAERKVLEICPDAIILRPSIIFGEEDDFFNRFASMARYSPVLPAIGFGKTKFQPVYVGDVARAVASALDRTAHGGTIYELGGPSIYSFKQLLHLTQRYSGSPERLFPVPFWLARLQGLVLQMLPGKILTLDQVRMLKRDNVISKEANAEGRTLSGLGITPTALEDVVPLYLEKYRPKGMYTSYWRID